MIETKDDDNELEIECPNAKFDVFDPNYEHYIADDLSSQINSNLALHPFSTNYLAIQELTVDDIKQSLWEAVDFLKDEESYGYWNVHDWCHFLLCDSCEKDW